MADVYDKERTLLREITPRAEDATPGVEVLATVPEAFKHPTDGYVGLHIMYRRL